MVVRSDIKAIILAGRRDFGRYPLAADLPTALWPVAGKPALQRLLDSLADQGIGNAVVCSNGESSLLAESIQADDRIEVEFLEESLPVGTAGALRDAGRAERDSVFIVFPANMVCVPQIERLLDMHRSAGSELTVAFNPDAVNAKQMGEASGIYVCSSDVLRHIPSGGYCDIKEGLIPEMVRVGKSVHAVVLPAHVGNFRGRRGYLSAVADYLENLDRSDVESMTCEENDSQDVWVSSGASVDSSARVCGPAVIMEGVKVSQGAVILGPTVLESNVEVGVDAVVVGSVVWDGARLEPNCRVQRSLIGRAAVVESNTVVQEQSISAARGLWAWRGDGVLKRGMKSESEVAGDKMRTVPRKTDEKLADWIPFGRKRLVALLGGACVLIAFLWSYAPQLADLWREWQVNEEHSSGLLVPFLAVYVLWVRRSEISECIAKPSILWGLLALAGAQAFRFYGLFYNYRTAERLSVPLTVGALVLLLFGWGVVRKLFTVLLFLFLMVPWPKPIQEPIAAPMQTWATTSAVFCLELLGYGVIQHGNVIDIEGTVVEVAWACNGLRMVTAFFVITGLVVLLVKREWWEKLIIFASSLPVALLCNTVRLTITSIAFTMLEGDHWEEIFHDFGGFAMMPLALAAVVGELWLLKKLTTPPVQLESIVITRKDA